MKNKISKKLLGAASLLAIIIGLSGCSSNTSQTFSTSTTTTVGASNYNQNSTSTAPRTRQS